jgi:hypothetical protein
MPAFADIIFSFSADCHIGVFGRWLILMVYAIIFAAAASFRLSISPAAISRQHAATLILRQ